MKTIFRKISHSILTRISSSPCLQMHKMFYACDNNRTHEALSCTVIELIVKILQTCKLDTLCLFSCKLQKLFIITVRNLTGAVNSQLSNKTISERTTQRANIETLVGIEIFHELKDVELKRVCRAQRNGREKNL